MNTRNTPISSSLVPHRGEIWRVRFDPVEGDEIRKIRPAVIISGDYYSPLKTKLAVPLTTWQSKFEDAIWMVKIEANLSNGLDHDSAADALQLRCISHGRLVSKLGEIHSSVLDEIVTSIAIVIGFK